MKTYLIKWLYVYMINNLQISLSSRILQFIDVNDYRYKI